MASTYVNNLRLNEMATGDASGTWGTVTNTNLELIGEALGFGTEAITTNADTHTTTVADGASDAGRAMYLKYTGTLDSACTITIAPNTMKRMQFIENATSGSQNIIISQGGGANVTIPPGDTKAVYLDGAGSGAAVVDAFASLSTVDLKVQDDLTVTDDVTIGGDIDVDGTTNLDVVDIDGALTQDGGAVFNEDSADVDFRVESNGNANMLFVDGGNDRVGIGTASPDTLLHLSDATGSSVIRLERNDTSIASDDIYGSIEFEGQDASSSSSGVRGSIKGIAESTTGGMGLAFSTAPSGGSNTEVMRIDRSGNVGIGRTPTAYGSFKVLDLAGSSGAIQKLIHTGSTVELQNYASSTVGAVGTATSHPLLFTTGDTERMRIDSSGNVGIGTTSPDRKLSIHAAVDTPALEIVPLTDDTSADTAVLRLWGTKFGSVDRFSEIRNVTNGATTNNELAFNTNGSERMRIDTSGNVGIGTASPEGITSGVTSLSISDTGSKTTDDKTGVLAFKTNDGSYTGTYSDGVTGEISSIAESSTGAAYGLAFLTGTISGTDRAERMRINNSGNVGIGTASPSQPLHVILNGTSTSKKYLLLTGDGSSGGVTGQTGIGFVPIGGGSNIHAKIDGIEEGTGTYKTALTFSTNDAASDTTAAEKMRIDSSGRVAIGNTVASSMFAGASSLVAGDGVGDDGITIYSGNASLGRIHFADGTSGNDIFAGFIAYDHNENDMLLGGKGSGSTIMTLEANGSVGAPSGTNL